MFFIDQNQFVLASQSHIDKVSVLANNILSNLEQLTNLNIKAARSALENAAANSHLFLENKDIRDPASLQAELVQPFNSWSLNYLRSIYDIGTKSRQDVASAFDDQMAELNENIVRTLEQTNTGAAGSEAGMRALKAAVATLNSAYENMSAAGKKAADIIDANATAVTESIVESGIAKLEDGDESGPIAQPASKSRSRKAPNEATQAE